MTNWFSASVIALLSFGLWGFFTKLAVLHIDSKSALIFQTLGVAIIGLITLGLMNFKPATDAKGLSYAILTGLAYGVGCLLILNTNAKKISSREAMLRTVNSSSLYSAWPATVEKDLILLKEAIKTHDFNQLGRTAESNALAMHATMLDAWPPVQYSLPQTIEMMQKIWDLRDQGLSIYFTQDAGPNLKLLFLEKDLTAVKTNFPEIELIKPF